MATNETTDADTTDEKSAPPPEDYSAYAERHNMNKVFQELLKGMILAKPTDPLTHIKDEIKNVAKGPTKT